MIAQGAEAIIEKKNALLIRKTRLQKLYRHPTIDAKLTKQRTRAEAKILTTLERKNVSAPKLHAVNEQERFLDMEFIRGEKFRDVLTKQNALFYAKQLGEIIALMHNANIIHNDLTTSNMIVRAHKIVLIDFGLSLISKRTEDKAVDLHLLSQALTSFHHDVASHFFATVLESYKKVATDTSVLSRLHDVQARGRNKH